MPCRAPQSLVLVRLAAGIVAAVGLATSEPSVANAAQASPTLTIGNPAPAIAFGETIRGEPIAKLERDTIYVFDFWATWCGPCIRAIPHLAKVQSRYAERGVVVVGVSVWESRPNSVRAFVEERSSDMTYTVVRDRVPAYPSEIHEGTRAAQRWAVERGAMSTQWLAAAGRGTIPAVMIVDRAGRIAWIGYPRDGFDDALAQIVAGTWKLDEAKRQYEHAQRVRAVMRELARHLRSGDRKSAIELAERELDRTLWNDASALNVIAWMIVDPQKPYDKRYYDLALKAAKRADELAPNDGAFLDTLARVYFSKGDVKKALELQKRAVAHARPEIKADLERALDEYREASGEVIL